MTSPMAEQRGASATRHKGSRRLLSRLRCGLQTRLSCTAGLSCRPSSTSESSSNLARRRDVATLDSRVEAVSGDRKRLRSRDRKSLSDDLVASVDSGVGRSSEMPDSASCATSVLLTSGHVTSGSTYSRATTCSTYDVIGRRRKRRSARLTAVNELDVPETEMVTWSRGQVTGNDVMEPLITTKHRCRVPERRELQHSCCNHFYGKLIVLLYS